VDLQRPFISNSRGHVELLTTETKFGTLRSLVVHRGGLRGSTKQLEALVITIAARTYW
jgi:hypothetical protein